MESRGTRISTSISHVHIRPLAQLTQFDQSMQIHSQQDPKLRTSSLFHANIQETSQKTEECSSH